MPTKRWLLLIFALVLSAAQTQAAADQSVTDLGDSNPLKPGELRYAIKQCQDGGGGTITFQVSGTITVSQGTFVINKTVVIDASTNPITLDGGGKTSGFYIQSGGNLTLKNLALTNFRGLGDGGAVAVASNTAALTVNHCQFFNNTTSASYSGGAIYSLGSLTITDSEFGGNKGGGGGALYPRFGSAGVTVMRCNFHDNEAIDTSGGGLGGAILLWDGANASVSGSTFTNNKAVKSGGAIHVLLHSTLNMETSTLTTNSLTGNASQGGAIANAGSLTLTDTTLSGNLALGLQAANGDLAKGGGIFNSGTATLSGVTLDANHVDMGGSGGGIYNSGTCTLTNVTLSGNIAHTYYPYNDLGGGGIYSEVGGTLTLTNVTLNGNIADGPMPYGSAISAYSPPTLTNTVIARGGSLSNCDGVNGGNGNLSDDGSCHFGDKRDNVPNLLLAPLANNGGPTATHLPQPGSAAIDNGTAGGPSKDQRNLPRPQGVTYDVGSVEVQPTDNSTPTPTPTPTATPTPTPTATPAPPSQLLNLSTRKQVGTGDNVLIGGFIVTGADDKNVLLRGLGPSLPVSGALANPTLELHKADTTLLAANDNWKDTQASEISATGIPPSNDLESAIVAALGAKAAADGGAGYTGVLAGNGGTTGIGLLEIYDLNTAANSKLANISTRGFVGTGDDLLIGGFIPGPSDRLPMKVLARALGPSLTAQGVSGALQDPVLELHDANGALVINDNWRDAPNASEIQATLPPPDDHEAAIITTLLPSNSGYTALVRGLNNSTGVALVEVYALNQ